MKPINEEDARPGHLNGNRRQDVEPSSSGLHFKDLEICALGCGADWDGKTDLEYVNEHDAENPRLKVLPIFGVRLTVERGGGAARWTTASTTADRCTTASMLTSMHP